MRKAIALFAEKETRDELRTVRDPWFPSVAWSESDHETSGQQPSLVSARGSRSRGRRV